EWFRRTNCDSNRFRSPNAVITAQKSAAQTWPAHFSCALTDLRDFLDQYQRLAAFTDQNPRRGAEGVGFPVLGLFGEIGSLLSALKKRQREHESYPGYAEAVVEEVGDVLWYLANVASRAGVN